MFFFVGIVLLGVERRLWLGVVMVFFFGCYVYLRRP
jgi:hypothetical protein